MERWWEHAATPVSVSHAGIWYQMAAVSTPWWGVCPGRGIPPLGDGAPGGGEQAENCQGAQE